jgi:hypothetical protein
MASKGLKGTLPSSVGNLVELTYGVDPIAI